MKNAFYLLILLAVFWMQPIAAFAQKASTSVKTDSNKGFYLLLDAAYLKSYATSGEYTWYSTKDWRMNGTNLRLSIGYFVIPQLSIGIGAGRDMYQAPDALTYPVFFELRTYLKAQGNSPYLMFDFGKSYKRDATRQEGVLLDAGIGYKVLVWRKIAMLGAINYNFKNFPDWWSFNDNIASWHYLKWHSISVRVGILF
ncbi:MAG TPA: hypothetical protein DCG69_10990 [Bacteroidales bacterium]|nr:hypothetical protein [Bacteroidales bacterium]